MPMTTEQRTQIIKAVVGVFGAAPGATYLDELSAYAGNTSTLIQDLTNTGAFLSLYPSYLTSSEFAGKYIASLLGDTVADAGKAWAVEWMRSGLEAGYTRGQMVLAAIDALGAVATTDANWGAAAQQLQNKVTVAEYYSVTLGIAETDLGALQSVVDGVNNTTDVSSTDKIQDIIDGVPGTVSGLTLTQSLDNLTGSDSDNVFTAPVTQNTTGSGELANTLETGDVLNGAGGRDILKATLISTGTVSDLGPGVAIAPDTTNIEEVYLTAQSSIDDTNANNTTFSSYIDAGDMTGVEQWWTDESRATIRIEDIRSRPVDTTFGMRLTDPNVGYEAYFNPLTMFGDLDSDSTLTIVIGQLTGGAIDTTLELSNLSVSALTFNLNGVTYTISSADMEAANTWAELEAAITDELAANDDLSGLAVTHVGSGQFQIFDAEGGEFTNQGGFSVTATTAGAIDIRNAITTDVVTVEEQTETTIILDGAGSGSQGGAVNIAAGSGDRGVEVFNVFVDRNSHITALTSENNPRNVPSGFELEQQLEEVYVAHLDSGAQGTLQLGARTVDAQGVSTTTDDRLVANALTDVRIFDASGFNAELKVGARLTLNILDKYLLGVTEPVQFSYLLGDAGSNLNLAVNNVLSADPDFALEIIGGAGDDRINLTGLQFKAATTIDGEAGNNTVEINTTTGVAAAGNTAAENSWESFTNIQNLVVAGNNNTVQNLVVGNMAGLTDVVIATGNVNTELQQLNAGTQSVTISGKNQTLGAGNNNNNQNIGIVTFTNTTAPASAELDLLLDNTARVDGVLTVAALTIAGPDSQVRSLNLESAGVRDTANVVTAINGNLVNTFNLVGSQDLTITNLASAANSTAAPANVASLLVDGSELAGDLYLGVTGAVITAIDAALGTNRTVELIGTDGEADILNIRGGVTTTNATTISEFETIRFGEGAVINVATNFNATNVSDVDLYDLVDSTAVINLTNLRATENVQINAGNVNDGTDIGADVLLAAANATAGSQVNVNFDSDATTTASFAGATTWDTAARTLSVRDFSTISLDMGGNAGASYNYNFNLDLQPSIVAPLTVKARTLEITGGQFDANFANVDSLTLNALDTALTVVDFSEYNGNFVTQGWDSTQGSNAEVLVNEFGFIFDVGGNNTVFAVPAGVAADVNEVQTLDFTAGGGFGNLANGESIIITFAGGEYVFTNNTGAVILQADIDNAIIADAANSSSAFTIATGGGNLVQLTATLDGNMPNTVVAATDGANVPGNVAVATTVAGDLVATNVTGFDLVTAVSEFLTKFTFTEDAYDFGVVWQIDNFQAIDAGDNVTISNQTQLDLRALGVDSSTKITISAGDVYRAAVNADAAMIADYTALGNYGAVGGDGIVQIQELTVNDTVITSNDGLDFTIILQGVAAADLQNENIVGIA